MEALDRRERELIGLFRRAEEADRKFVLDVARKMATKAAERRALAFVFQPLRPQQSGRHSWQLWVFANKKEASRAIGLAASTKFWATSGPHLRGNKG
jgi:hypothetical protein